MTYFPKSVVVEDHNVIIDDVPFPYHIGGQGGVYDNGQEVLELGDDHMLILTLQVLLPFGTGSDRVTVVDRRAEATERRRQLAAAWNGGWMASGDPQSERVLVTSDHEVGMAWRAGFQAERDGLAAISNPYIVDGEKLDGSPKS